MCTFILVDENTNKVLCGLMADGMYYSLEDGDIPLNTLIFNDESYLDMMICEPQIYDEVSGLWVDVKNLSKIELKRNNR